MEKGLPHPTRSCASVLLLKSPTNRICHPILLNPPRSVCIRVPPKKLNEPLLVCIHVTPKKPYEPYLPSDPPKSS